MPVRTSVKLVYNKFPAIAKQLPKAALEIIEETIDDINETVKHGMASPKSGRVYVRGNRLHTASAPGEMPAIDTTKLISSLQHQIVRGEYKGYYYTESVYAPMLEYGTSKMAPRPFMTPAAERARRAFMRKMKNLEDRLR